MNFYKIILMDKMGRKREEIDVMAETPIDAYILMQELTWNKHKECLDLYSIEDMETKKYYVLGSYISPEWSDCCSRTLFQLASLTKKPPLHNYSLTYITSLLERPIALVAYSVKAENPLDAIHLNREIHWDALLGAYLVKLIDTDLGKIYINYEDFDEFKRLANLEVTQLMKLHPIRKIEDGTY